MARHTKQNRFTGGTPRHRVVKGGAAQDLTTKGTHPCWCEGEICTIKRGHQTWPGQREGHPHPRTKEEAEQMVEMAVKIQPKDMKGFHRDVQVWLKRCINDWGMKWRPAADAILLYPPDGESQPLKISHQRQAAAQVTYLKDFAEKWDIIPEGGPFRIPKPDVFTGEDAEPEPKNDKALSAKAAPQVKFTGKADPPKAEAGEWVPYLSKKDGLRTNWETDGTQFRCLLCIAEGKSTVYDDNKRLGGHVRMSHSSTRRDLYTPEARAKAQETKRIRKLNKALIEHTEGLMAALGIEAGDKALEAENKDLRKRLDEAETMALEAAERAEQAEARVQALTDALAPFTAALRAAQGSS